MKIFEELNDDNWMMYASKYYKNVQCTSVEEFYDDLQRFKYLKRLFKRYLNNDDLQERLILNHIIVLNNVFGIEETNKMLFYKIDKDQWPILKTFLVYLNFLSEDAYVEIPLDQNIIKVLRAI
jgi:hypothetical protein|tara:strand:+ start:509 stop:877 length:369 start_codon:yes stop_codon:yes gene_type:complete